jgi:hypothetical protein
MKPFIPYFPERLPAILGAGLPADCLAGFPASGVAYCLSKIQTEIYPVEFENYSTGA